VSAEKISNFDVLKRMCEKNMDIRLATSENLVRMTVCHYGRDTQITIGVQGNVIADICDHRLHCCLLLWDKQQYAEAKAELQREAEQ
jgi:hypothetical protein